MPVPFIDLRRFEPGLLDNWMTRVRHLTETTQFVGGEAVATLEGRIAKDNGVAGCVGCANGTDALQLALRAVGVEAGDTVVLPDATFWATFEAVVNVGGKPVTVDIDPRDLQMDFGRFEEALERFRPKAAILVHLYGWGSARLDDFRRLCRERSIPLIEDGAQAYGVTWRGASIYRDALVSTISFYPAKVLGASGDAGAVLTSDPDLVEPLRQFGNHGRTSHYEHGLVGWNSRMGGLDAAYLDLGLDHLDTRLAGRRRLAAAYRQRLTPLGIDTIAPPEGYVENGYLSVALIDPDERPPMQEALRARGIGVGTVYPGAMSEQPGARGHLAGTVGGEHAARLGRSVLNLPLFAGMTDDEFETVIEAMTAITS